MVNSTYSSSGVSSPAHIKTADGTVVTILTPVTPGVLIQILKKINRLHYITRYN